jgi:hypothetical protein
VLIVSLTLGSQGWGLERSSWQKSAENRSKVREQIQQDVGQTALLLSVPPGCGPRCERGIRAVKVRQTISGQGKEKNGSRPCKKHN